MRDFPVRRHESGLELRWATEVEKPEGRRWVEVRVASLNIVSNSSMSSSAMPYAVIRARKLGLRSSGKVADHDVDSGDVLVCIGDLFEALLGLPPRFRKAISA